MAKTFLELKQETTILTQHTGVDSNDNITYDANFMAKAGTWIQLSHKLLAEIYDYWVELQGKYNFTSEDGTEAYSMPADFDKPFRIYDLTNKKKLTIETQEKYYDANISAIADATKGIPDKARFYGVSDEQVQLELGLIPDDEYSYRVLYKKIPTELSADGSKPFIDADRYLIFDTVGYAWKWEQQEQKAAFAWQKAQEALTALLNNQMTRLSPDYQHKVINTWTQAHRA